MTDRLTLVFLVDALGYAQAGDPTFLPLLDAPRTPVRGVLGYSSGAIPTLLSGALPSEHGHLAMYRRAGPDSVFRRHRFWLGAASRWTRRHWTLRRLLARALRAGGVTGYFALYDVPLEWLQHFDLVQRRDLFAPGGFPGRDGLADLAARSNARIWNWGIPEERAFRELESEIDRGERRFLLLYTSELDALMHAVGPNAGSVRDRLHRYGERINEVIARARRRYREVRVFVFGDHGMAQVDRTHDLWSDLRALDLRVPNDFVYFLDSTMARFWFRTDRGRGRTLELLQRLDYGRILSESELQRLGAWFPEAEYGEILFLLREGDLIVPSFMSQGKVAGMHGYHPDDPSASTVFLTNCRDVLPPSDLTGIFRILASELASIGDREARS